MQTKTKFTPGPWRMEDRKAPAGNNCGINICDDDLIICRLPDGASTYGGFGWPHQLANARLIAACPDIIEALELVVETLSSYVHKMDVKKHFSEKVAMEAARTAIRKALGE